MGYPVTLPEMPQSRQYHPGKESLPGLYCFHNIFCTILSAYVSTLFSHESSACRIIYRRTHRIRKILNSRRTGGFAKRGNRKCGCLPGVPGNSGAHRRSFCGRTSPGASSYDFHHSGSNSMGCHGTLPPGHAEHPADPCQRENSHHYGWIRTIL